MKKIIKEGRSKSDSKAADADVKVRVENMLRRVSEGGDGAVRQLSLELDKWAPASFRLSPQQISDIVLSIPAQTIEDIKFAQAQVRNFALLQKEAIKDIEVETLPGVILGHRNIPVNSVGCYVPGGRYPMVASAHMSVLTERSASGH